jgi:hypothetical protein
MSVTHTVVAELAARLTKPRADHIAIDQLSSLVGDQVRAGTRRGDFARCREEYYGCLTARGRAHPLLGTE